MNDVCRERLSAWAGRAYLVLGDELEEIASMLSDYIQTPIAFDTQKNLLLGILVSGCPNEVKLAYDIYLKTKGKKKKITEEEKAIRKTWNQKYRYRVIRLLDTIKAISFILYNNQI